MKRNKLSDIAWALLVVNVYLVVYIGVYGMLSSQKARYMWSGATTLLTSLFAATAAGLVWHKASPRQKPVWLWMWIGASLWAIADIVWGYLDVTLPQGAPDVSLADGFWLAGYVAVLVSFTLYFIGIKTPLTWGKALLVIVGGMIIPLLAFLAFFLPEFEAVSGLATLVYALYPALDIILATGGFLILATFERGHPWESWHLISVAQIFWAYSDTWYWLLSSLDVYGKDMTTNFRSTFMVDLPAMVASVLLGMGCLLVARHSGESAK